MAYWYPHVVPQCFVSKLLIFELMSCDLIHLYFTTLIQTKYYASYLTTTATCSQTSKWLAVAVRHPNDWQLQSDIQMTCSCSQTSKWLAVAVRHPNDLQLQSDIQMTCSCSPTSESSGLESCTLSGRGIDNVPGCMFVEAGYHGVKLPSKLYCVHIRRWLEKCCFQYCDLNSICGYFRWMQHCGV